MSTTMNNTTLPAQDAQDGSFIIEGSVPNRQAKRLQLRKLGFRAKVLSNRDISPQISRPSDSFSNRQNMTPIASMDGASDSKDASENAGVLQEISNSTRRRQKQSRARLDDNFSVWQDENTTSTPKTTPRSRQPSSRSWSSYMTPEAASRIRNSSKELRLLVASSNIDPSIDTEKYIQHLEAELVGLQTQLCSLTSPTVLQARSSKMRALKAETRVLQNEVAQWETKFDERVQEEIQERNRIEAGYKAQIRSLENDVEEYAQKTRDLQIQLEASVATISATETANDELEKQIYAITDLVASPNKHQIEHVIFDSPTRKRHNRQKSMLPRFPTTGSLALPYKSYEMPPPMTPYFGPTTKSSLQDGLNVAIPFSNNDISLTALTPLTQDDSSGRSVASSDPPSGSSSNKRFSWPTPAGNNLNEQPVTQSPGKPGRKMRKFHASNMPKPLLLPSTTSGLHQIPMSAPPMEAHESPASFPFPGIPDETEMPFYTGDAILSPLAPPLPMALPSSLPSSGRRRARTDTDGTHLDFIRMSLPFMASPTPDSPTALAAIEQVPKEDMLEETQETPRVFSSLGPMVGRNLLQELQAAKGRDNVSDLMGELNNFSDFESDIKNAPGSNETEKPIRDSRQSSSNKSTQIIRRRAWTCHQRSMSDQTGLPHEGTTQEKGDAVRTNEEQWQMYQARNILPSLWRQLYDTARQSLQYAQSITLRSNTVQRLQWWLVQLFLGPQISRRMMFSSMRMPRRPFDSMHLQGHSPSPSRRSATLSSIEHELNTFSNDALARQSREKQLSQQPTQWFTRHNPLLWMRFSLTMAFAVGAAIRDGPGAVMDVEGEKKRI